MRNAIGAALALVLASSGAQASGLSKSSDEELWGQLNSISDKSWCRFAPILKELSRRQPDDRSLYINVIKAQSICFAEQGKVELAMARAMDLAKSGQDEDLIALQFAMKFDRVDNVLALLRSTLFDQSHAITSADRIRVINRTASYLKERRRGEELGRLTLDAALAGRADTIGADLASFIALHALRTATRDKSHVIANLLLHIKDPWDYPILLASRDYEPIWQMVEQRVGPQFSGVTGEYLERARIAHQNAPNDTQAIRNLAYALHFSGRHEDAVAFVTDWRASSGGDTPIDEQVAWAIEITAYSLDALGREREADALFDEIGTIEPQEKPWVVNFAVNRALRLVRHGRWNDGLAATEVARQATDVSGNAYAKSLVAGARVCALEKLGRSGEAEPEMSFLLRTDKEWVGVTVGALMCLGRDQDAVQLVLDVLADPSKRSSLLEELQPNETNLYFTRSILPKPRDLLERNQKVYAEFNTVARAIPARYHSPAWLSSH